MASYSIVPRPDQPPPDQNVAPRAHSRFVEGSMNDRVSNAPPPTFLGAEEMAAYERQFYAESNYTRSSRPTSGSEQSFNRNSGNKFWDGIRERFTRTKSSSSITTVSSSKSRSSNRFSQQSQQSQITSSAPNDKENVSSPGYYPSREEVMENYKSLVEAGFFSSHAIQGTRHHPPPSRSGLKTDQPLPAPPPPATGAPAPFLRPLAQQQRQVPQQTQHQAQLQPNPAAPALSSLFASIPYSATQPSPTGDAPKTTYARPDPRPPISLPKKYRRPHPASATAYTMVSPPLPPVTSPSRGTKRANADMTGGTVDREMANISTDNLPIAEAAGTTRKLVKKLRKSASRISADLSLRPATSSGNGSATNNHPYSHYGPVSGGGSTSDVRAGTSSTSVNLVPRPPMSSAGRTVGSVVRSFSNSFKRNDGAKTAASSSSELVAPQQQQQQAAVNTLPLPSTTPNKLVKAKRSITRKVSLGRARSGSISAPSSAFPPPVPSSHLSPPPVPSHAPPPPPIPAAGPHRQQLSLVPPFDQYAAPLPRQSYETTQGWDGEDPMVLDDAEPTETEPATRNPSLDVMRPGGLSVPSFHYPQRQKRRQQIAGGAGAPLAAVEDSNRVAAATLERGMGNGHVKSGSFCFGPPTGGAMKGVVGEGGKENEGGEFAVF